MDEIMSIIMEELGYVSAIFMSSKKRGVDIVMPTEELGIVAQRLNRRIIESRENQVKRQSEYCLGEPCTCNPRIIKVKAKRKK